MDAGRLRNTPGRDLIRNHALLSLVLRTLRSFDPRAPRHQGRGLLSLGYSPVLVHRAPHCRLAPMVTHRFLPAFGILGAVLGLTGIILAQWTTTVNNWIIILCETLALVCLGIYFAGTWEQLKVFSARRSTRLGLNSILAVLLLSGIVVIINFLAIRHGGRWDFSETRRFTLSPQTHHVLHDLHQPVTVTVFSHERSPGYPAYRDLLESYAHANSALSVRFVDPEQQPQLAKQLKITKMDTAVFQSGDHTIYVTNPTEAELTSALIRVTRTQQKTIVFVEGHGERDIHNLERSGYSYAEELLTKQGYTVSQVSVDEIRTLSTSPTVVVIAGPQRPYTSTEQRYLAKYLKQGGRLLLLLDPETTTGLETWVSQWGVTLTAGIVVDPLDRIAQGSPTALLIRRFTGHDITLDFTNPVLLPVSRILLPHEEGDSGWQFDPLVHTSKQSWLETNFDDPNPVFNEGDDRKGPFILAAALTPKRSIRHESLLSNPKLVLVGNSAFASNAYLKLFPGNVDFFLKTVAWLADETALISIAPKESAEYPFIPNPTQEHLLLAIQVFSLPLLFLLLGITIWRRRRHT
ncbi:MAG: hypothetical protein D6704_09885 [Nitrospirae bacterium]|nr:MAG: hypothetical protein D6704_09885 [Nitrospirota bacterium]